MYAIVRTGSKQYKVKKGDVLEVERLNKKAGSRIQLKEVLLVHDGKEIAIGKPFLKNTTLDCEVLAHLRGKKTIAFRYRAKKSTRRKVGHRQELTKLEVKSIAVSQ
ncbi:MAG: 50S ribosomal protein L21 [Candidatus Omnitrophota bacterium]|nr:50S ribosomal protein L21 [Candidatus Omnitrophota bacterium]